MNKQDYQNHLIQTTLTRNATTLYTCENVQLAHGLPNVNCSEIISQELGLINASKTLIGSVPVPTSKSNMELVIVFIKKILTNSDGSTDLITVITIAHVNINRTLVLSVLKKIMDKYIEFKKDVETSLDTSDATKSKLGEFKMYMSQIIKFEEMNYSLNLKPYNYGSIQDEESSAGDEVISPQSLVLVNEEVEEVRQLMLDNISKLMARGDKINLLVDQTDRLTNSALMFQKRAQLIKRRMWVGKAKFYLMVVLGVVVIVYILGSSVCGFPGWGKCR